MDCSPPGCFDHADQRQEYWSGLPGSCGSRQEYWGGLPCPPPGDFPDLGIKPASLTSPALAGGFLPLAPPGKPKVY